LWDFARHLVSKGTLHAAEEYVPRLQRLLGAETTFAEAYARSGRVLNIAVVAADTREPCRLLNYLTAPNVVIWSAVACSSAFPLLFAPQELLCKDVSGRLVPHHPSGTAGPSGCLRRWCDGSLEEDLPMRGLSEMFSINFFLCSEFMFTSRAYLWE
jgi:TAG lipase / steryl ester hydrolase / phospholipase A2 / LPA acyltransferase